MDDSSAKGRAGERKFEELCELADLFVSTPIPDRTGKDRFVEFDLAPFSLTARYDKRPGPITCYVQIKTTGRTTSSVRMKLSNAERLLRDPKPAFVFVARVVGRIVGSCYLIHIDETYQARILKRLREEQKKENPFIHRISCTFPFDETNKIEDTPISLRNALLHSIGADMFTCARKKEENLDRLGYDSGRHTI